MKNLNENSNKKKYLFLFLIYFLIFCSILIFGVIGFRYYKYGSFSPFSTEEIEKNMIEKEGLEIEIKTDKTNYSRDEEINIEIIVKNTNAFLVGNILPTFVSNNYLQIIKEYGDKAISIHPGKSYSFRYTFKAPAYTFIIIIGIIVLFLFFFSLFLVLHFMKREKNSALKVETFIILFLFLTLFSYQTILADSSQELNKIEINKITMISNQNYNIEFSVSYENISLISQTPKIIFDTSTFQQESSKDGDFYIIDSFLTGINGSLVNAQDIITMEYSLKNEKEILQKDTIIPDKTWTIPELNLTFGTQILEVKAETVHYGTIQEKLILLNLNADFSKYSLPSSDSFITSAQLPEDIKKFLNINLDGKEDQDEDGLPDAFEVFYTKTDPNQADTDNNGINDALEDFDGDELNNAQELLYQTNPRLMDTDDDGLSDSNEVTVYNTDPLNEDTDKDGLNDFWEIQIGSDPLVVEDKFERTLTYTGDSENITYPSIKVFDLEADQVSNLSVFPAIDQKFINQNIPGSFDNGFEFYIKGEISSAELIFHFNEELFEIEGFEPAIYYYDQKKQCLQEVPDQYQDGTTIIAEINHFSKYILLNKKEYENFWNLNIRKPTDQIENMQSEIVFIIDASGSMSTDDTPKNDADGIRLKVASDMVDSLDDNTKSAVISFGNGATLLQELSNDKTKIKKAISSVGSNGGTAMYDALKLGAQLFTDNSKTQNRIIVLLTDGMDNNSSTALNDVLYDIVEKELTIYTVGLGYELDETVLSNLADSSGGRYFYADVATNLLDIFQDIQQDNIDYITDSNEDGLSDYYTKLLCDNKIRTGLGENLFDGVSYDEFQQNNDFDGDGVKNGEEIQIRLENNIVYLYVISNPLQLDSDFDDIPDNTDANPLIKDRNDIVFWKSKRSKLNDKNGKLAPDLLSGSLSEDDIFSISDLFRPLFERQIKESETTLWNNFNFLARMGSICDEAMFKVLKDMIQHFKEGSGSDYSNEVLTEKITNNKVTQDYIETVETEVIKFLETNGGDLNSLDWQTKSSIDNYFQQNVDLPKYSSFTNGLAIAIHGTWGNIVSIKDFTLDQQGNFEGTLHFYMYDHFGLDKGDVDNSNKAYFGFPGFAEWFLLQHFEKFENKYKPFVTIIEIDHKFEGKVK